MPRVALFVPCFVDQLFPGVAVSALRLLERHGCQVIVPEGQTCCGQPMANAGAAAAARPLVARFAGVFAGADFVVAPSGSCVAMVRHQHPELLPGDAGVAAAAARTFELCEFLHDVLGVRQVDAPCPRTVALHRSCHGLRGLRLGAGSERRVPPFDKVRALLETLRGIRLVEPERTDECCGFGGTFAVTEEEVSSLIGRDRLDDLARAGADLVTGVDSSCLMHLEGLARRERRPLRFRHVAELLAGVEA